jgi:hypothetical protein
MRAVRCKMTKVLGGPPCGQFMTLLGYTSKELLDVHVCPKCDGTPPAAEKKKAA